VNIGPSPRLEADREHVGFVARDAFIDIARIAELLLPGTSQAGVSDLEEAAILLQGEFSRRPRSSHCYRFHHWCLAERQRLGQLRRQVLDALIQRLGGEPERSLVHAHALVAADPLSEAAHATLVRLLVEAGRMHDADAHYEYARDLLRREVAAPLSGALRRPTVVARLARTEIAKQSSAVPPAADDTASAAPPSFVGRRAEQRTIAGAVTSLAAGSASGMLLFTGEPGIGKTRLLQILTETAVRAGIRVISARGFEGEMIRPYGFWIDALKDFPNDDFEDRAQRLLGSTPPPTAMDANESSREKLFEHVAGQLRDLAKRQPLAITLDDLQWIDEGSASLLHFLIRTGQTAPQILFVGAARDGEIDDNPWAQRLLASLERDRRVDRHTLGPLDVAETASLFEDGLSSSEAMEAHRASGGNPLFALEVARGRRNGLSIAAGEFRNLIADRINRLDEARRELIQFASANWSRL